MSKEALTEAEVHYYLFELGNTVVKEQNYIWYVRDRVNHYWEKDNSWDRRFFDVQYDVIEIDYDEASETIKNRRMIPGDWSKWAEEQTNHYKE